ncbi:MAG TPA: CdaR family protein [Candidatus Limnocylindria bacterium]|jgi:YbbR domain-containing protein
MGWLVRNWQLKLAAVAVATVLYTGLVFSGTFSDESIRLRIEQSGVSRDVFVLSGDLGLVEVRYRVANDQAINVTEADFVASVDIAEYDMQRAPEPQQLPVEVATLRDGIEVLEITPSEVRVEVDRIEVRSVPVEVDTGAIPDGLEIDDPVVSATEVEVRGPASVVESVDRAVAFISIPASGIDVNEAVDLVAVDTRDQPVAAGTVEIDPETVSVQVAVRAIETQTTVAVRPNVEPGTPAPGFALEVLQVEPSTVTIVGLPEVLAEIDSIQTAPISIDGVSSDQTFEVELELPDGVRLASGEQDVVTVTATIGPSVSSRTFVVGLVCEGAGDNACLPGLDQVAITVSGSGEALSAISAGDVTPTLNVAGLAPGEYELAPAISGLPAGVELLSISPGTVPVAIVAPEPPPTPVPTP